MANPVDLPSPLVDAVRAGEAILFLGAGASIGAKHPAGAKPPKGWELRDKLAEKFLSGRMKDRTLAAVGQFSINEAGLNAVQSYIRDIYVDFSPADFHSRIPLFRWQTIATTNYDLVVNRAFGNAPPESQDLVPFVKDNQEVEREAKRYVDPLKFIKLHGCIDHITDPEIPLILSTDQYTNFSKHRQRLFEMVRGLAHEFPIVFVGYSLDDPNMQNILFDLFDNNIRRPSYYTVAPRFDEIEERQFHRQRIIPIKATFEGLVAALDAAIPVSARSLSRLLPTIKSSLSLYLSSNVRSESEETKRYLETDVLHVHSSLPGKGVKASDYYKGYDEGIDGVRAGLDVKRRVGDTLLIDSVLEEETSSRAVTELFVLRGAAGSGKTTILKRAAWDAATEFGALVLYLRTQGAIHPKRIEEISELTGRRIFVFVDRPALRAGELATAMRYLSQKKIKATFITAERDNEWNVRCDILEPFVSNSYPVRNLTDDEIANLLGKLEANTALGTLEEYEPQARLVVLKERAQRQILVALHEATQGRPFEDIINDEYSGIIPDEAKLLYLDICTLNRFGVGVRAGLISRISGIDFTSFQEDLFKPLENVVFHGYDKYIGDRIFRARHAHVASIVFAEALPDPEEKLNQIVRIIRGINISFNTDREAFGALVRGRAVVDTFPSVEMGRSLYRVAAEVAHDSAYLLHQQGIFELNHLGGSVDRAEECLQRAEELAPHDKSIQHSVANLYRKKALQQENPLLRAEFRKRALTRLNSIRSDVDSDHVYSAVTRLSLLTDELKEILGDFESRQNQRGGEDRVLVEKIKEIETTLISAHRAHGADEFILSAEATYRTLIKDYPRALKSLEQAFKLNPRQEWIAIRLADLFLDDNSTDHAIETLTTLVRENPSAQEGHFRLAVLFAQSKDVVTRTKARSHFRSSFSNGDQNFQAQGWYYRELFIAGDYNEAEAILQGLERAKMAPALRRRIFGVIAGANGKPEEFHGNITKSEVGYMFVNSPAYGRSFFAHESSTSSQEWIKISALDEVTFNIAFTMKGPTAINLKRRL